MKKRRKRRKRRKKLNKINLLISLIIFFTLYSHINSSTNISSNLNTTIAKITHPSEYETIKQDTNSDYPGVGQEKIDGMDGYFTTFTTCDEHPKIYKEYKQNGDASWSRHEYWGGTMEENGCGITAIATILSGYNKSYTPEALRKRYSPVLKNDSISNELSQTFMIKNSDFYYDSSHLSKEKLQEHLKTNRPILICVWNKPNDNRWTTASHYMALLATTDTMVYVSNPNGGKNDSKSSGWYKYEDVTPYIAKALYIKSY